MYNILNRSIYTSFSRGMLEVTLKYMIRIIFKMYIFITEMIE